MPGSWEETGRRSRRPNTSLSLQPKCLAFPEKQLTATPRERERAAIFGSHSLLNGDGLRDDWGAGWKHSDFCLSLHFFLMLFSSSFLYVHGHLASILYNIICL